MIASSVFYSQEVPVEAPQRLHSNFSFPANIIAMPQPVQAAGMTLGAAIAALKAAKLVSNRRRIYVTELDRILRQFARGRENAPLASITLEAVEAWLAERKFKPSSHLAAIGRLATLFQYAKKKRWLVVNVCEEIEKPYTDWKTPFIFTPEQCEKLLRHCQEAWPERLLYLSLCLHCGVRPNESRQVKPSDITDDTVRIDAAVSKVRVPRIVHMHSTGAAWIKHALPKAQLPICESVRKRWVKAFAAFMEFKEGWPQDACRHTACSYWLAERQDLQYIAMQLGNSGTVIMKHYRDLVSKETAAKFWAIMP